MIPIRVQETVTFASTCSFASLLRGIIRLESVLMNNIQHNRCVFISTPLLATSNFVKCWPNTREFLDRFPSVDTILRWKYFCNATNLWINNNLWGDLWWLKLKSCFRHTPRRMFWQLFAWRRRRSMQTLPTVQSFKLIIVFWHRDLD